MALSKKIVSQFVKNTVSNKPKNSETFVQGYMHYNEEDNQYYVKLHEGSTELIPARCTTNVNTEHPVTVMIKNHSAVVIGNAYTTEETSSRPGIKKVYNSTAEDIEIESITAADINALWEDS